MLRRYRGGDDATDEIAVMAYLAEHGFPVPAVWPGPTAGELVMQRLSGMTMVEALVSGAITAERAGELLAELLRRLHAIPARLSADPRHRVLHLDFHPENVVPTPQGPMVIDWTTAAEGPPGLDSAMAALILAQAALTMPAASEVARAVLSSLLRHLGSVEEVHLAEAARTRRSSDPALSPEEVGKLDEAVALVNRTAGS